MYIEYHTRKESIYTHKFEGNQDYWIKEDKNGKIHPLVEGLPISVKQKIQ